MYASMTEKNMASIHSCNEVRRMEDLSFEKRATR